MTWHSEQLSPDGLWLAVAESHSGGSLGGSYDVTSVHLKRTKSSEAPIQVLLFSHEYPTMKLGMKWISANHLVVTYSSRANLDFQAIKCAGITISVEDETNGSEVQ